MKHILIVEDDPDIQELLCAYLQDAGYAVAPASDGVEAMDRFHSGCFDLVLLDLMLPKIDGFGVCELIRRTSSVPIIMLTALDGEAEQLRGFDLQIDDYIPKPFSIPILLRKIAAVLRRTGGEARANRLQFRDLTLDLDAVQAWQGQTPLELTAREMCIRDRSCKISPKNGSSDLDRQNHRCYNKSNQKSISSLQGRVKFPIGGKVRERSGAGFGAIPKPTVQSGWKKTRLSVSDRRGRCFPPALVTSLSHPIAPRSSSGRVFLRPKGARTWTKPLCAGPSTWPGGAAAGSAPTRWWAR